MTIDPVPSRSRRLLRRTAAVVLAGLLLATSAGIAPVAAAPASTAPAPAAPASAAGYRGPHPGAFTGLGFDTCAAPSDAAMTAWLQSPYRAVGVYLGGVNRGCAQPNLTRDWVDRQQAKGWRLFPLYVGLQAPCSSYSRRIDPAQAAAQGSAAADDAATRAGALGLVANSTIILDLERYPAGNAACTAAVLRFTAAWTTRLHERGYLAGLYTDVASAGLADHVGAYGRAGQVVPDVLDFARWDGVRSTADPAVPAGHWQPKRRMKQYQGDHQETWGGVRITVDSNQLDLEPSATRHRSATATGRRPWSAALWSVVLRAVRTTGAAVARP